MVAPEVEVVHDAHADGSVPKGMGGADSAQKGHAASYQASQVIAQCQDLLIGPQRQLLQDSLLHVCDACM